MSSWRPSSASSLAKVRDHSPWKALVELLLFQRPLHLLPDQVAGLFGRCVADILTGCHVHLSRAGMFDKPMPFYIKAGWTTAAVVYVIFVSSWAWRDYGRYQKSSTERKER